MGHPYRGNDDREMSGEGDVDESAEHEAAEHAEEQRRADPDAIADEETPGDRDGGAGPAG